MPRSARIDIPGVLYHVIVRGENKGTLVTKACQRFKKQLAEDKGLREQIKGLEVEISTFKVDPSSLDKGEDMLQEKMIENIREKCHQDIRVVSALMFGSFATGEGDQYSDIEFAVFIRDDSFNDFDQRSWLDSFSPVAAYFLDDFGHHTALFENGVRGEFHFMRASEQSVVAGWQGYGWFPSLEAAVLLDREGELSQYARLLVGGPPKREGAELVEGLSLNLINLMLFGANLLNRGEYARAWAFLGKAHESLLKLARLYEGRTDHWPTPSRGLETDLSGNAYHRYLNCTASAERVPLCRAYGESWRWSSELMEAVAKPHNIELPQSVMARVKILLDNVSADPNP